MTMKIISIELKPWPDARQIGNMVKSPNFFSATAAIDNENIPVFIKSTCDGHNEYFDKDGNVIYRHSINRLTIEMKVSPVFGCGSIHIFNEPTPFKELNIPIGKYICKYICLRTMRVSIDLLNFNVRVSSIGGKSLFEMDKYKVLSVQEILDEV